MNEKPSMLKAALIGGGALGVAGGLPLVNFLNCACCALVIAGGFVAAYIYSKDCTRAAVAFRPGTGAMVGLIASPFYALASTIVGGLASLAWPQDMDEMIRQMEGSGMPPEAVEMIEKFASTSEGVIGWILGFFLALLLAVVFSTLGGLIGGAVFKNEPAAPLSSPSGMPPPPPPPSGV